jgi:hypothetical protein
MFHHAGERSAGSGSPSETIDRLPLAMSVAIIAGLSTLSWAILIVIAVALDVVL